MDQCAPTPRTPPRASALRSQAVSVEWSERESDMQGSRPNCRSCEGSSESVSAADRVLLGKRSRLPFHGSAGDAPALQFVNDNCEASPHLASDL